VKEEELKQSKKSTEWICLLFLAVSGFSLLPQRGKRALRLQREKEQQINVATRKDAMNATINLLLL